jgi:hypothetical protein
LETVDLLISVVALVKGQSAHWLASHQSAHWLEGVKFLIAANGTTENVNSRQACANLWQPGSCVILSLYKVPDSVWAT